MNTNQVAAELFSRLNEKNKPRLDNINRVVKCPVCGLIYKGFLPTEVLKRCAQCGAKIFPNVRKLGNEAI